MQCLTELEVADLLPSVPEWKLEQGMLVREFRFPDFVAAIRFVDQLAIEAEAAGHHPDIDIRYNRVRLALVTHDAHGITRKDFQLARAADGLYLPA